MSLENDKLNIPPGFIDPADRKPKRKRKIKSTVDKKYPRPEKVWNESKDRWEFQ